MRLRCCVIPNSLDGDKLASGAHRGVRVDSFAVWSYLEMGVRRGISRISGVSNETNNRALGDSLARRNIAGVAVEVRVVVDGSVVGVEVC